jgi:hypothetical protein
MRDYRILGDAPAGGGGGNDCRSPEVVQKQFSFQSEGKYRGYLGDLEVRYYVSAHSRGFPIPLNHRSECDPDYDSLFFPGTTD